MSNGSLHFCHVVTVSELRTSTCACIYVHLYKLLSIIFSTTISTFFDIWMENVFNLLLCWRVCVSHEPCFFVGECVCRTSPAPLLQSMGHMMLAEHGSHDATLRKWQPTHRLCIQRRLDTRHTWCNHIAILLTQHLLRHWCLLKRSWGRIE